MFIPFFSQLWLPRETVKSNTGAIFVFDLKNTSTGATMRHISLLFAFFLQSIYRRMIVFCTMFLVYMDYMTDLDENEVLL